MTIRKFLVVFVLSILIGFSLSACGSKREKYATEQFRNIAEVVKATEDTERPLAKEAALAIIKEVAQTAADTLDPEKEVKPITTASAIVVRPQEELQKILESAKAGPSEGWFNWPTILGVGALVAGLAGRFLGPPFNIVGNIVQFTASKFVPNYDKTKAATVGLIASTEKMLVDYGAILDSMPEVKAKLTLRLNGRDPVEWMKENLRKTQVDLGSHNEVAEIIKLMKTEMTTKDGIISPTVAEIDNFISKKI